MFFLEECADKMVFLLCKKEFTVRMIMKSQFLTCFLKVIIFHRLNISALHNYYILY